MNDEKQKFLWTPPALVTVPVEDSSELFPVYRVFFVGRNYAAHVEEMNAEIDEPFYFTKSPYAITLSGSVIPYPPETSNFHHEMELVVALSSDAFRIDTAEADSIVYGYCCGLDMTRRDLQQDARKKGRPWDVGKDTEECAVIAPIVPKTTTGAITSGRIELRVNGESRQDSDVSLLLYNVPRLIAHLSRFYHLRAGDLIYTGTPSGVGPVEARDVLEGSVDGVGEIRLEIGPAE